MENKIAKKTIILYVLYILKKGTCKTAPATLTEMAKILNSMGIECDRKTVGRNVGYLIDFGYPIVKIKGGGCYMNGDLDKSKIWMNIDNDDEKEGLW